MNPVQCTSRPRERVPLTCIGIASRQHADGTLVGVLSCCLWSVPPLGLQIQFHPNLGSAAFWRFGLMPLPHTVEWFTRNPAASWLPHQRLRAPGHSRGLARRSRRVFPGNSVKREARGLMHRRRTSAWRSEKVQETNCGVIAESAYEFFFPLFGRFLKGV